MSCFHTLFVPLSPLTHNWELEMDTPKILEMGKPENKSVRPALPRFVVLEILSEGAIGYQVSIAVHREAIYMRSFLYFIGTVPSLAMTLLVFLELWFEFLCCAVTPITRNFAGDVTPTSGLGNAKLIHILPGNHDYTILHYDTGSCRNLSYFRLFLPQHKLNLPNLHHIEHYPDIFLFFIIFLPYSKNFLSIQKSTAN